MRVLHVLAPARFGGLESMVLHLAAAQALRGHEIHLASIFHGRPNRHSFLKACRRVEAIRLHPLWIHPRRYWAERRWVQRLVQELQPDVIHTHGYRCDVLHGLLRNKANLAFVSTLHGFTNGTKKKRLYHWLQLHTLRSFHGVVPVSREILSAARRAGIESNSLFHIPNGLNPTTPLPPHAARDVLGLKESDFNIGWVGRLTEEKGVDVMVVTAALLGDGPWVLSVVGSGPEGERAKELASSLGIGEKCRWHGTVEGVARLLKAFDVLVVSSRSEGTPMIVLEAMAAGVPIVASVVGGIPDLLDDSTGFVVPPESPRALADGIEAVRRDPIMAGLRAGQARRRLEERHGAGDWAEQYDHVYRNALLQCRGKRSGPGF